MKGDKRYGSYGLGLADMGERQCTFGRFKPLKSSSYGEKPLQTITLDKSNVVRDREQAGTKSPGTYLAYDVIMEDKMGWL
jgi:hypothetical protein